MSETETRPPDLVVARTAIEAVVRVGVVLLLLAWVFLLARPFIGAIVWGVIIAVAVHPAYVRLREWLGGRAGLAAGLLTGAALLLLMLPLGMLLRTLVANISALAGVLAEGQVVVPPPPAWLPELPLVGGPAARFWELAMVNLGAALSEVAPQLRAASAWLLSLAGALGLGVLNFVIAMVVAGLLLARDESAARMAEAIAARLAAERGRALLDLSERTVRSVTKGILGTALIQAMLAGIGLMAAGVPGAALLTLVAFLLCIVQIGPALVLLPAVIYVFAAMDPLTGGLLLIWSVAVGLSDNVLKPYLMSRGSTVPLAVILLGVVGGLLLHGLIGLFIGPIVLALAYELFRAWLAGPEAVA